MVQFGASFTRMAAFLYEQTLGQDNISVFGIMPMNRAELEKRLDNGERWGFRKDTETPTYLGWILITKRKPSPITPFDPKGEPERYSQWMEWRKELLRLPYHVAIRELRRDVHESDDYEDTDDYRLRENYYVSNLDEVQKILDNYNCKIEDARLSVELDAP